MLEKRKEKKRTDRHGLPFKSLCGRLKRGQDESQTDMPETKKQMVFKIKDVELNVKIVMFTVEIVEDFTVQIDVYCPNKPHVVR